MVKVTENQGVVVAPVEDVVEVKTYTAAEFFAQFTEDEVNAFYAQIDGGNNMLRLTRDMIMATSTPLAVDNPLVIGGVFALQASGVITPERGAEILGNG